MRATAVPITWALATFHASGVVAVALLVAYSQRGLGPLFSSLNTVVGLALFGGLWATTYVATRRALRGLDLADRPIDGDRLLWGALRWGAVNGAMFLATLVAVIAVSAVVARPETLVDVARAPQLFAGAALLLAYGSIATGVAMVVGGLIGVVLGGIDLILLGIARRLVPPATSDG